MLRLLRLHLVVALAVVGAGCQNDKASSPAETRGAPVEKIALNRATLKQLEALPGVGVEKAKSILASRNARGGRFDKLEDIVAIDGIGEKTLEAIRPYVTLD